MKKRSYGWSRQPLDDRDLTHNLKSTSLLPPYINLADQMLPVFDQGQLGSCTANAIAAAVGYQLKKETSLSFMASRLFIYYNERVIDGTVNQDAGANPRSGIKTINIQGIAPESLWPYDISKFKTKPSTKAYQAATFHKSVLYVSPKQDVDVLKTSLARGVPVLFGFDVKSSFESKKVEETGLYTPIESSPTIGGHYVLIVGYDDKKGNFIVRNSWGPDWGMAGYFQMPYESVVDARMCSDFWELTMISHS